MVIFNTLAYVLYARFLTRRQTDAGTLKLLKDIQCSYYRSNAMIAVLGSFLEYKRIFIPMVSLIVYAVATPRHRRSINDCLGGQADLPGKPRTLQYFGYNAIALLNLVKLCKRCNKIIFQILLAEIMKFSMNHIEPHFEAWVWLELKSGYKPALETPKRQINLKYMCILRFYYLSSTNTALF